MTSITININCYKKKRTVTGHIASKSGKTKSTLLKMWSRVSLPLSVSPVGVPWGDTGSHFLFPLCFSVKCKSHNNCAMCCYLCVMGWSRMLVDCQNILLIEQCWSVKFSLIAWHRASGRSGHLSDRKWKDLRFSLSVYLSQIQTKAQQKGQELRNLLWWLGTKKPNRVY